MKRPEAVAAGRLVVLHALAKGAAALPPFDPPCRGPRPDEELRFAANGLAGLELRGLETLLTVAAKRITHITGVVSPGMDSAGGSGI
jgi:hypothetical protein